MGGEVAAMRKTVTATEFKAKCLALIDEVNKKGGSVTITKRGKIVAELTPIAPEPWPSIEGLFEGQTAGFEDLMDPDGPSIWPAEPSEPRI